MSLHDASSSHSPRLSAQPQYHPRQQPQPGTVPPSSTAQLAPGRDSNAVPMAPAMRTIDPGVARKLVFHVSESGTDNESTPTEPDSTEASANASNHEHELSASESKAIRPKQLTPPIESTGHLSPIESSSPVVTAISTTYGFKQLPSATRALFKNIRKGNRKFFENLPTTLREQRRRNIDINCQDPQTQRTPLTAALAFKEWSIAVELLSRGADPILLDGRGDAPRELATPLCKMVLQFFAWRTEKRADPAKWSNEQEKDYRELLGTVDSVMGQTMLVWAASKRHDKLARLLIEAGADFRKPAKGGEGPFEAACRAGSVAAVGAMLEAWPSMVTDDTHRPYFRLALRAAIQANRPAVVELLLCEFRNVHRAASVQQAPAEEVDSYEIPLPTLSSSKSKGETRADADCGEEEGDVKLPSAAELLADDAGHPRNAHVEEEAYRFFFGTKPSSTATLDKAMYNTRNDFLLTAEECALLKLKDMEMLAVQLQFAKVVEMIEAYYKARLGSLGKGSAFASE